MKFHLLEGKYFLNHLPFYNIAVIINDDKFVALLTGRLDQILRINDPCVYAFLVFIVKVYFIIIHNSVNL